MTNRPGGIRAGDASLVAAARTGDREAFGALVLRHRPLLVRLCRRMLHDAALAEDAAQEAVVAALLNLDRLRRHDRFGPWLAGIGLNVCRQWLRTSSRGLWSWESLLGGRQVPDVADPGPSPAELAEEAELAVLVKEAVAVLPDGQRAAVVLFYLEGLTYRESAHALGINVGTLKSRLHKARANLQRHLSDLFQEPTVRTDVPPPVPMRVVDVHRLDDDGDRKHIILLEEASGDRQLPIWVGPYEATGIAFALRSVELPRPFTWHLTASLLQASGSVITEVRICRIVDGTFYALIRLRQGDRDAEVDARPSDALNLALIADAAITVEQDVLDTCQQQEAERPDQAAAVVLQRSAGGAEQIVSERMAAWPH
ncbi:MAG: bifunctional nuclease domain-containing protein [Egibacteraceae bacterium]